MKYLIDTHILIQLAVSPEKIPQTILNIIINPDNEIIVSTVSFWEIAIKQSVGKLDSNGLEISDLEQMCHEQNIGIVQLPLFAIKQYKKLTMKENHRDPFDRALISLCVSSNYTFLSVDTKLEQYKSDGLSFISQY